MASDCDGPSCLHSHRDSVDDEIDIESCMSISSYRQRHRKVTLEDVLAAVKNGHARTPKVPANTFVISSVVLPTLPLLQIAGAAPGSKTLPLST